MSLIGDILNKITGKKPEQQTPRPPAATQSRPVAVDSVAKPKPPLQLTPNAGPVPSPTYRILTERMPDVKTTAEAVYNGQVAARPGPLAAPIQAPNEQQNQRPTVNDAQLRPPGTRPQPTIGGPGMGAAPRPVQQQRPATTPAPQPAAKRPPVKTFDEFIGAGKKPGRGI